MPGFVSTLRQAIEKPVLQAAPRKIGIWMFGPTLFLLWEKLGAVVFLLIPWYHARVGISGERVSPIILPVSVWLITVT